jgi:hypothetical protein
MNSIEICYFFLAALKYYQIIYWHLIYIFTFVYTNVHFSNYIIFRTVFVFIGIQSKALFF